MILFHGGGPDLWRGSTIKPNMAHTRLVDGCADCEAHRHGQQRLDGDPLTPEGFVYATSDRDYARYYASRAVKGWLYEVELDPASIEESKEDPFPTWRASSAVVIRVLEKRITLTMQERRDLFVKWGGTPSEFETMLNKTVGNRFWHPALRDIR